MCRRDGLMVKTKCCKGENPGSIPASVESNFESILISGIVFNSTRDEKELSRITKGVTASVGEVV